MNDTNTTKNSTPFAQTSEGALELCKNIQQASEALAQIVKGELPIAQTAFVVVGRGANPLSQIEWSVRVFVDEAKAEAFRARCAQQIEVFCEKGIDPRERSRSECYDPKANFEYGPPSYCVRELPFGDF